MTTIDKIKINIEPYKDLENNFTNYWKYTDFYRPLPKPIIIYLSDRDDLIESMNLPLYKKEGVY